MTTATISETEANSLLNDEEVHPNNLGPILICVRQQPNSAPRKGGIVLLKWTAINVGFNADVGKEIRRPGNDENRLWLSRPGRSFATQRCCWLAIVKCCVLGF